MAETPIVYRSLPGRGSNLLARTRLWEGPDHLLVVTSWPSGEGYKRFFFADLQAVIIRQTSRRLMVNIALLVLALITAGPIALISDGDIGALVGAGVIAGFWLLFILINSLLGPTCATHFQTAVQTEQVVSLVRLSTALKVLARIQPRILAAQGQETAAPPAKE